MMMGALVALLGGGCRSLAHLSSSSVRGLAGGGYHLSGDPVWIYYETLVVSVSLLLAGPAETAGLAGALTVAALTSARPGLQGNLLSVLQPLGLLWATVVVSWLSSTNLYTVLRWAMESQARAWRTAAEVSRRREQLRRTLDSLRNAHTALAEPPRTGRGSAGGGSLADQGSVRLNIA